MTLHIKLSGFLLILLLLLNYLVLPLETFKSNSQNSQNSQNSKNLVFTSAGNNTKFDELWCQSGRNYDVWVVYYGNNDEIYQNIGKR